MQPGRGGAQRGGATLAVTDILGDTLATLTGPASPGVHRVYWNYMGKRPAAPPLSPSQRRDSLVNAREMQKIVDSLVAAGQPRATLERLQQQLTSGSGFRFGRGGGSQDPYGELEFDARPGETTPRPANPTAPGAAAPAAPRTPSAQPSEDEVRDVFFSALRNSGLRTRGGFGGFGGGGPQPVPAGDYLVSLTVNGQTMRQVLRVERVAGVTDEAVLTMVLEEMGLADHGEDHDEP